MKINRALNFQITGFIKYQDLLNRVIQFIETNVETPIEPNFVGIITEAQERVTEMKMIAQRTACYNAVNDWNFSERWVFDLMC